MSRRLRCTETVSAGCPRPGSRCSRCSLTGGRAARQSCATRSPARGLDRLRAGQALGRAGAGRSPGVDHAVGRGPHRARDERWRVDHLSAAMGLDEVVAGRGDRASHPTRGPGRTGRAVAARLRPRYGGRHQVVAGVDRRCRAPGAGRPPRGRGRSRRADRIPAARRPGSDRSGGAMGRAPAGAGSDDDGLVGAGVVPRSAQGAVVRHQRQRGSHRGGTGGSWAAGARATPARSSCRCSRTSARKAARPRARGGAPDRVARWHTSAAEVSSPLSKIAGAGQ